MWNWGQHCMNKSLLKSVEQGHLLNFTQAVGTQFPPCFPLSFIPSPALQDGTLKKWENGTFATILITLEEVQKWFHVFGSFKILLHSRSQVNASARLCHVLIFTSLRVWYQVWYNCRPRGPVLLCSLCSISSSSCWGVNPLKEGELEGHKITTSNLSRCWSNDCMPYSGWVLSGKWHFLLSMAGVLYAFIAREMDYQTRLCSHFHVILMHF